MLQKYHSQKFKIAEDNDGKRIKIPLKHFIEYMSLQKDDNPLYLFGSVKNSDKLPHILNDFEVPNYFRDDILHFIDERKRPPFRWLLLGPIRSGSKVHIDPFKTSAWNTLFCGVKKWVMFPEKCLKGDVRGKEFILKGIIFCFLRVLIDLTF